MLKEYAVGKLLNIEGLQKCASIRVFIYKKIPEYEL